jgi:hypothetical protein
MNIEENPRFLLPFSSFDTYFRSTACNPEETYKTDFASHKREENMNE